MLKGNEFENKVAIVTGSAHGIGKKIAEQLHERGANVVLSDIDVSAGERAAALLGKRALFIPCNVGVQDQVYALVEKTIEQFGKLDIMINNAGINSVKSEDRVTIDQYPDETWHKIIDIDLNGAFYCCKAASIAMIRQGSGSIINIGSIAGVVALRLQIGFVAAKAAILKMTKAMGCELADSGIRVNAVSPGSIVTDASRELFYSNAGSFSTQAERVISFIPQNRPGEAFEIADAVLFLASDSSSYINGHNIVVDGGWVAGFNRDF